MPSATATVIGAGVFGTCVADALRADGLAVTLVEQAEPGHTNSSSGGRTRVIRCGHGDARGDHYARSARRAWTLWQGIEERLGVPLLTRTGALWLAATVDGVERAAHDRLAALGIPAEWLDARQLADDPRLDTRDLAGALHEPDAGVLAAGPAVAALVADLATRGVRVLRGLAVPDAAGRPALDGASLDADVVVWATGAWLGCQFPRLALVRPARREYVYVTTPADWQPRAPVLIDVAAGVYVLPDVDGAGVKIADDLGLGDAIDLDAPEREPDPAVETRLRAWATRRAPSLAAAPRTGGRVCAYELTPDDEFLVARHPAAPHVWLVGGGSGHGFKHGPALGADVAALIASGAEPDARFGLGARAAGAALRASPPAASGLHLAANVE